MPVLGIRGRLAPRVTAKRDWARFSQQNTWACAIEIDASVWPV